MGAVQVGAWVMSGCVGVGVCGCHAGLGGVTDRGQAACDGGQQAEVWVWVCECSWLPCMRMCIHVPCKEEVALRLPGCA